MITCWRCGSKEVEATCMICPNCGYGSGCAAGATPPPVVRGTPYPPAGYVNPPAPDYTALLERIADTLEAIRQELIDARLAR